MKHENIIQSKSYAFAFRVIEVYKYLKLEKKEWVLSEQLLRSGTSIGANIEEAIGAQSRKDFIAKISIAYKEARETTYWIRLLSDSGYLSTSWGISLKTDSEELQKIITSILKSTKRNS